MTAVLTKPLHSQGTFSCETERMTRATVNVAKVALVATTATPAAVLAFTAATNGSAFLALVSLFLALPAFALGMGLFSGTQSDAGVLTEPPTASDQFFATNDVNPRNGRDWSHYDARVSLHDRTH